MRPRALVAGAMAVLGVAGAAVLGGKPEQKIHCRTRLLSGREIDLGELTPAECFRVGDLENRRSRKATTEKP